MKEANRRFLLCMYEVIATKEKGCENITCFCKKTGLYKQKVSRIRSGEQDISIEDVMSICKHFGFRSDWILFEKGDKR